MKAPVKPSHKAVEPLRSPLGRPFADIMQARLSRRNVLQGGLGLATIGLLPSVALVGCGSNGNNSGGVSTNAPQLGFKSLSPQDGVNLLADMVQVPEGYSAQVLIPWGTPITGGMPAFDDGNAGNNTAAAQAMQVGMHHDGMYFFPLPAGSNTSNNGLLCINHENITAAYLHPNGQTFDGGGNRTVPEEVRKEHAAHGIGVVQLQRADGGQWSVTNSGMNRRVTLNTPMRMSGPVANTPFLQTAYDPAGGTTRGTVNNCANGYTPWNTYLTCEENWAGYFFDSTAAASLPREKARYGAGAAFFGYAWHTLAGDPSEQNEEFRRFDTTPTAGSATSDYRNECNNYGWIVEIDPFNPASTPVKRTALGRFGHEAVRPSPIRDGEQIAFYMGDDSTGEYIYKFVTADVYDADSPDTDMLDNGTLYVARFNEDGTGAWLPLVFGQGSLNAPGFTSQADVLVNTRSAADAVGATPMDRPEWSAVDPASGEVYVTLTNNSARGQSGSAQGNQPIDAANPRNYDRGTGQDNDANGNVNGHIIRWREDGDDPTGTSFAWDIFLFGARASAVDSVNISQLDASNQFSSPDGLWFDNRADRGILWIETDDGAISDVTNNQLLACIPGAVGDGGTLTIDGQQTSVGQTLGPDRLRRFLVGPSECEITGIDMTPDGKTLFVNIQHPGEDGDAASPTSTFPGGTGTLPRSATVAISKDDGGIVGS